MTASDFWGITDIAQNPLVEVEMSATTHSYILTIAFGAQPNNLPNAINGIKIRHNNDLGHKLIILRYQNGSFSTPIPIT